MQARRLALNFITPPTDPSNEVVNKAQSTEFNVVAYGHEKLKKRTCGFYTYGPIGNFTKITNYPLLRGPRPLVFEL